MQTVTKTRIVPSEFKGLYDESYRYIILYGGRAGGKSHQVAEALLRRGRAKTIRILCTREIQNTIRDSVYRLLADKIESLGFHDYDIGRDTIVNKMTGTEFIFKGLRRNVTEIKSTEGIDIAWVEEGQSMSRESLDILIPTIRKPRSQIIVTFNRYTELDSVYQYFVINERPRSYIRKVNYDVMERMGWLPQDVRDEIETDKANPALFAHKWLGEPISQSERAIIDRTSILDAMQREIEGDGQIIVGVDVARMGDDRTVFWKRKGLKTIDYRVMSKLRVNEICDRLEQFVGFDKSTQLKVDDTGVGGGVTDEMMKRKYSVVAVNFGHKAQNNDKYPNWISEAWFYLSTHISEIQLPYDPDLLMELSTRHWAQDVKGKRAVESKNEYKKRGFRSPDLADACIICYAESDLITSADIAM